MLVVVKQLSGLGNQLFQYAAGRYYAKQYGAELRVITDPPEFALSHGEFPRPVLLSHFSLKAPLVEVTDWEWRLLSGRRSQRALTAPVRKLLGVEVYREKAEQFHQFQPLLPIPLRTRTLYLTGYWQTHQIPDTGGDDLRAEFQLKEPPSAYNQLVLNQIHSVVDPVSVHIRRGDYALAAEGNIVLPREYYLGAVAALRQRLAMPTFFVFSDDLVYAREVLPPDLPAVFVEGNDDFTSYEDLRLMSACRHHVIANSSFSWWGAWLNPYRDKIVIAPRHWHLTKDSFYPELFPPGWLLLDSLRSSP